VKVKNQDKIGLFISTFLHHFWASSVVYIFNPPDDSSPIVKLVNGK